MTPTYVLPGSRCENINALTRIMYHHAKLADLVDMLAVENPARPFGIGAVSLQYRYRVKQTSRT